MDEHLREYISAILDQQQSLGTIEKYELFLDGEYYPEREEMIRRHNARYGIDSAAVRGDWLYLGAPGFHGFLSLDDLLEDTDTEDEAALQEISETLDYLCRQIRSVPAKDYKLRNLN